MEITKQLSLQLNNSLINNLGKQSHETQDIGIKFPYNPNLVQISRFNFKTARNEYDLRNTVFKRRNIRGRDGRVTLIKPKRTTTLNESPVKEQTPAVNKTPVKDAAFDDIFKVSIRPCATQRRQPSKIHSSRELLNSVKGIHNFDQNNQSLKQNKWTENFSPNKETQITLATSTSKVDRNRRIPKSNPDYGVFNSKQSTDASHTKDELNAENTIKNYQK